jgi:hypothetical protein
MVKSFQLTVKKKTNGHNSKEIIIKQVVSGECSSEYADTGLARWMRVCLSFNCDVSNRDFLPVDTSGNG